MQEQKLAKLVRPLEGVTPEDGIFPTLIASLSTFRNSQPHPRISQVYQVGVAI